MGSVPQLTEDQSNGPYGFIFRLLASANELLELAKNNSTRHVSLPHTIGMLSMLEHVIDSERLLVVSGSSTTAPEQKAEMERQLNAFRKEIADLAKLTEHTALSDSLNQLGESIKLSFLHSATQ